MSDTIAEAVITASPTRVGSRSTVVDAGRRGAGGRGHVDRAGVNEQLTSTFRLLHRDLVNYCARRCDDRQRAEDVAQEIFARASVHAHENGDVPRWPWLMIAARRELRDRSARHGAIPVDSDVLDGPDSRHDPAVLATAAEDDQWLQDQLGRLSADQRDVLVLTDRGWSTQEVARLLNLTTDNVRQLRHRARTRLQAAWTEREELHGLALLPLLGQRLWDHARLLAARFRDRLDPNAWSSLGSMSEVALGAVASAAVVGAVLTTTPPPTTSPTIDQAPMVAADVNGPPMSGPVHSTTAPELPNADSATPTTMSWHGEASDQPGAAADRDVEVRVGTSDVPAVNDRAQAATNAETKDGSRTIGEQVAVKTPAGDVTRDTTTQVKCSGRSGEAICEAYDKSSGLAP